jgi:hypothetical protein
VICRLGLLSQLLFDIAQACRAIQEFNAQGSLADYAADSMRRAEKR